MYTSKVRPKKLHIIMNQSPVEDSCLEGCWHCCTREVFYGVSLTEKEYKALKEYGAEYLSLEDTGPVLRFDKKRCCEFLAGGKCSLYKSDIRPTKCRLFTCFKT
jgi:hypothetical protein